MCVLYCSLYPFLLSEERPGLWCDENTHLWLKQALLSCVCSQLYLSSPPCPSISWRRCLLSGRWDTAWLCAADVHHGSDISIETAGWYLVVICHRRRCWVFFLDTLKPLSTLPNISKCSRSHTVMTRQFSLPRYLGFTQRITRCFPWSDFITTNKPLKQHACRQHLKNHLVGSF